MRRLILLFLLAVVLGLAQTAVPGQYSAQAISTTSVRITWTYSGTTGSFKLFKDGAEYQTLTGSSRNYTDTGQTPGSTHTYYVIAYSSGGVASLPTATATVRLWVSSLTGNVVDGVYQTPAGASETYCADGIYPAQWTWDPDRTRDTAPLPAIAGTPRVEQWRNQSSPGTQCTWENYQATCTLLAVYDKVGGTGAGTAQNSYLNPTVAAGPFNRNQYRQWNEGDLFLVYPAIYGGTGNFPWLGPLSTNAAEYNAGIRITPKNITIRGVTVDGYRPVIKRLGGNTNNTLGGSLVYIQQSEGVTFENIDIDGVDLVSIGKSLFYSFANRNLTIRDSRIGNSRPAVANGIFGTQNTGTLTVDRVYLYNNGGDSGPEHNLYMTAGAEVDFTVHFKNSWSTDVYYGHLFKSRAQRNIVEGSYFQGTVPMGDVQAEAFLVDFPNGGIVTMRNNILVKNASGLNSNGIMTYYAGEGWIDARPLAYTSENNTFVSFAKYWADTQPIYPFRFPDAWGFPNTSTFPIDPADVSVKDNVFIGLCTNTDAAFRNYRGTTAIIGGFADLNLDFSLTTAYTGETDDNIGNTSYSHVTLGGGTRFTGVVGAKDLPTDPNIDTESLAPGVVGVPYSQTLIATGASPFTWAIIEGALPAGLSLNSSTGVISGTPTVAGDHTFVVEVEDFNVNTGTATFPLSIRAAASRTVSFGGATIGK